ncbi:MAG: hypothetical protein Q7S02_06515 [bacterium]|nr:hypothetical protein [bacterium]
MTSPRRSNEALLAAWGERGRVLPPHLSTVRDTVLTRVAQTPARPSTPRPLLRFPWLSLACTGFAILVLFIRIPSPPLRTVQPSAPLAASKSALRQEELKAPASAPAATTIEGMVVRCTECGGGGFEEEAGVEYVAAVGLSTRDVRETKWSMIRYGLAALFGIFALITASITWTRTHRP